MKTKQPTTPVLIAIKNDETIFYINGEINRSPIYSDQDGQLYYLYDRKGYYLPKEFQPSLMVF